MASNRTLGIVVITGLALWAWSQGRVEAATILPTVSTEAAKALASQKGITEAQAKQELQEAAIATGTGPRVTIPGAPAFSSPQEEEAYIRSQYTQAGIDYDAWLAGATGVRAMTVAQLEKSKRILETQATLGETQPWLAEEAKKQLAEVTTELDIREAELQPAPEPAPTPTPTPSGNGDGDYGVPGWAAGSEELWI